MVIEEKDFRLIPISDSSPKYDLELLHLIQPKGKEARLEFKNVAYGIDLENAIKRIAHFRVCRNHKDEAVKLVTYFEELKAELNSIRTLCTV